MSGIFGSIFKNIFPWIRIKGGSINNIDDPTDEHGVGDQGFYDLRYGGISAKGADIASADPLVIGTDGDYFDVTGTTGFASMTVAANRHFFLQFDGILTMTHHATNLDLPGEANITTAAGDVGEFFSTGANTVQCVNFVRASGESIAVLAHKASHQNTGGDEISVTGLSGLLADDQHVLDAEVLAAAGENTGITSMSGLNDDGIPVAKVDGAATEASLQPPAPVAFAGSAGRTITHNYGHTDYQLIINPVADPGGFLGEIWLNKSANTVVVYNSGVAVGNFDYVIIPGS